MKPWVIKMQRLIYDALEPEKFKPHDYPITEKLRRSCLGASSKRNLILAARKTEQVGLSILSLSHIISFLVSHEVVPVLSVLRFFSLEASIESFPNDLYDNLPILISENFSVLM